MAERVDGLSHWEETEGIHLVGGLGILKGPFLNPGLRIGVVPRNGQRAPTSDSQCVENVGFLGFWGNCVGSEERMILS